MAIEWWIGWLIMTGASTLVGMARGQFGSGLVWGALLGPLGIIIVLFLPNKAAEARAVVQQRKDSEQTELLKRTLAAQEEQIRLLRAMTTTAPQEGRGEEAEQLEEFIPESMKGKPRFKDFERRK